MALFRRARRDEPEQESGDLFLIVGLGNPDAEYEGTRHNVGARVVEVIAGRLGERLKRSKLQANVAEARLGERRLVIARPTTYMNDSGRAVARLAAYYRVPPPRIVVVHDEIDLPLARIRIKEGGGSAGHRGIDSIVSSLSTNAFPRVRVGVGRPPGRTDAAGHVLKEFSKRERQGVDVAVEEAADAALAIVEDGVAVAQNRFNTAPQA